MSSIRLGASSRVDIRHMASFHKHSPFQSIQMSRRCPHLRKHVEHMIMQGAQLLWYTRSNQTWRLHNSGFGCHTKPLTWDSRSFLMGIGQGGATSSSVRPRDQGWFSQFGAVSITEAPCYDPAFYLLACWWRCSSRRAWEIAHPCYLFIT